MNPGVISKLDRSYCKSYPEWSEDYWQWFLSIPENEHPVLDKIGSSCGNGEEGSVWFIPGSFVGPVTRNCAMPANTSLGIFVKVKYCSNAEDK